MLTVRSIWELDQLRKTDDLLTLFTGTRSIFSAAIEAHGWRQRTHPVSFADLQTLDRLSTAVPAHCFGMDSIAFNLNFQKYSSNLTLPIHFSSNLKNVLIFSSQKAGETIKAIIARCSELLNAPPGFFSALEIKEIEKIRAKYDIYEHPGHRVIYAVRLQAHFVKPDLSQWLEQAQAHHKELSLSGIELSMPKIPELAIHADIPQDHIVGKWVSAIDFQKENQYPGPLGRLDELIERGYDLNEKQGHFSLFNRDTQITLPLKSGESTDAIFEAYHLVCK
jgi:hypothetical protein